MLRKNSHGPNVKWDDRALKTRKICATLKLLTEGREEGDKRGAVRDYNVLEFCKTEFGDVAGVPRCVALRHFECSCAGKQYLNRTSGRWMIVKPVGCVGEENGIREEEIGCDFRPRIFGQIMF